METLDRALRLTLGRKELRARASARPTPLRGAGFRPLLDQTIARQAVTLLHNHGDVLPLTSLRDTTLLVTLGPDSTGAVFVGRWRAYAPAAHLAAGAAFERRRFEQSLRGARRLVVLDPCAPSAAGSAADSALALAAQRRLPTVYVAACDRVLPIARDADAYLLSFDASPASQIAAADAVLGFQAIGGRLPAPGGRGVGIGIAQQRPRIGPPESIGMSAARLGRIEALLTEAIENHAFPGAAVAVGRKGVITYLRGFGAFTYSARQPVTPGAVYDIASITKVVSTTTLAMLLVEQNQLSLDRTVTSYLPEFTGGDKSKVTVRQLLLHESGLPAAAPYTREAVGAPEQMARLLIETPLETAPGREARYSDVGMAVLGFVIERIAGEPLPTLAERLVFRPLEMNHTGFRPATGISDTTIVPTELDRTFRRRIVQGEVHDEVAYLLGGAAGHAGLFSTAVDLSAFCFLMLNGGEAAGRRLLRPETIEQFTTRPAPGAARALGWDLRSPSGFSTAGSFFGAKSYGHTGFTGSSLWIDPETGLFVILLTNRIFPSRYNQRHQAVRAQLADLAYQAIEGPPAPLLPRPPRQSARR